MKLILNWNRSKPATLLVITMVRKRPIKPDPISAGKRGTHVCYLMYQLSKAGEKPARVAVVSALRSGLMLASFPLEQNIGVEI